LKVTTKVATGAFILIALLFLLLVRNLALVRDLTRDHEALFEVRFSAVVTSLELIKLIEQTEERTLKFIVTRDPAYAAHLERISDEVERAIDRQRAARLSGRELELLDEISREFAEHEGLFEPRVADLPTATSEEREELRSEVVARLDALRVLASDLLDEIQLETAEQVALARQQAMESERISWLLAVLSIVWALIFVLVVVHALNRPLGQLIEATRRVAEGRFSKVSMSGRDELASLSRAFDEMVERLDEIEQMKSHFLSRVSHELKTPLAAMQETNQLLFEELAGPLTPKQKRLLELNLDAGRRLSSMLTRLLDLSRLEAGAVHYAVCEQNLNDLVAASFQEFEGKMRDKSLEGVLSLSTEALPIEADRDWLMQVFENLLENAIKFSTQGSKLTMASAKACFSSQELAALPERAKRCLASGPHALVRVIDEGSGIPPQAIERVFERFFQLQGQRKVAGGVGLGLAICQDIVAAHSGAIYATSPGVGLGSTFHVLLPLRREDDEEGEDDEVNETVLANAEQPPKTA
jgi:two-component system sensor histidine kinase GlrK